MPTLYFFGDSWSSEESEIEVLIQKKKITVNEPVKSYPAIVSELLRLPYKNYSFPGTSQTHVIQQVLKSDISAGDHAIFSLTAPSRRFYFNNVGDSENTLIDENKNAVNDYQDNWLSSLACYSLYQLCRQKLVNPWFLKTFNVSYLKDSNDSLWELIPDNVWLVPKTTCIVATEFDPEFFDQFDEYKNIDFHSWLKTDNQQVQQYIRPCRDHPNMLGRKKIAEKVAAELRKKSNEFI